jgi:hypothetical protein
VSAVSDLAQDQHDGQGGRPHEEEPVDMRPYLCIPYWTAPISPGDTGDTGELRPLPGNVISWLCPGIHASPYTPGEQLDVHVDVRNSGRGSATALATVLVYWADATVGFTKPRLLGAASVAVQPRGGRAVTRTISGVIPSTASNHICLLCLVTHSLDKPGNTPNPLGDRHWAQRNLTAVGASPGVPVIVPFLAANPFAHEAGFQLRAQMLEFDLLRQLALHIGGVPTDMGVHVRLLDERGGVIGEGPRAGTALELDVGGQRLFNVALELLGELSADELIAVEAVLVANELEHPVGSLGIVLRNPEAPPLRRR